MAPYALGLDYGTESVRALVIDCATGAEAAAAVRNYSHGVITDKLPGDDKPLPPEFALQHPGDYLAGGIAVIKEVLATVDAGAIVGIGVDFTACTMLPVLADGTPLMSLDPFKDNPHAWVKLWKHHAAQPEADRINTLARERDEKFLRYYSGIISSEWMLPKCLEIAIHAPEVYAAADIMIDAGDWLVHQLTGKFVRNACAAGYKGLWNGELGFPSPEFLAALDGRVAGLQDKWLKNILPAGLPAGEVTPEFAELSGLRPGTPVSAATIDAHSGVPGMGVADGGAMSIIMGTSSCHLVLSRDLVLFDGYAGAVKDGILPGFYGYESGQSAVGDIFGWFAKDILQPQGEPFAEISRKAAQLRPGETGLVALDWLNGNRSVLMDARLSGAILGLTLASRSEEIYRALLEGCAFGTRVIVDSYTQGGIPIEKLVVCGGLTQDPLIMQIHADVTGLPLQVAASDQAVALGAAIFGALAAGAAGGGFATIDEAIAGMTKPPVKTFMPTPDARQVYDELYSIYQHCHDHFGRENTGLMRSLKALRNLHRHKE